MIIFSNITVNNIITKRNGNYKTLRVTLISYIMIKSRIFPILSSKHTHPHVHTHTHSYTHSHTYTHTHKHTHMHTHSLTYAHIHTHTHIRTVTHTHVHARTYTHTHIRTHSLTHTHIHTYIYIYIIEMTVRTYVFTLACILHICTCVGPRVYEEAKYIRIHLEHAMGEI